MTMDERVEAAVEAFGTAGWATLGLGDIRKSPEAKEWASQYIREILAAAFPELHGDKTHWLAPVEPADEMIRAGRREAAFVISDAASIYRAMGAAARGERTEAADAYLGKGDGG